MKEKTTKKFHNLILVISSLIERIERLEKKFDELKNFHELSRVEKIMKSIDEIEEAKKDE